MATIINQATLSYGGNTVISNPAIGELIDPVSVFAAAPIRTYKAEDDLVSVLVMTNSTPTVFTNLDVTINLGAYSSPYGTLIPLNFSGEPLGYYINGVFQPEPAYSILPNGDLEITGINIPANGNTMILFSTIVNTFAPLDVGSTITNEVVISGGNLGTPTTVNSLFNVLEYTDLSFAKSQDISCASTPNEMTYTFVITNKGNIAVEASDDFQLTDNFIPPFDFITVTLDGTLLSDGTDYIYDLSSSSEGTLTTTPGLITIPAATFVQDTVTGEYKTNPGAVIMKVTGTFI